ncbi:MAG: DNA polymerase III subunit alpha [Planctomycetota bacterium]
MTDFVHLHVHSDFSILDGAASISSLLKRAVADKMTALALTEHGNMFGAIEFYTEAMKAGIKPIIGYEAYVAPRTIQDKDRERFHLTLLVKDLTGYRNLCALASIAFLDGFYYKPRIDRELLRKYHEGLIALSGCLSSGVSHHILNNNYATARDWASEMATIFGRDNFYLELQHNTVEGQERNFAEHLKLAKELDLPVVATNDIHYLAREDAEAHDAFLCIGHGKLVKDTERHRFSTDEFYFRTRAEMHQLFAAVPEALANTVKIAARCNLEFKFGVQHMPVFQGPVGIENPDYLEELCFEGLKKRYGGTPKEAVQRLEHELDVIEKMGFVNYFLIVQDFVRYAEDSGIPVGPGRGSAAGSIVSYCLGITKIDPLRYGLLFERFLNEGRNEPPDIDIDFCRDRREEVIDYVKQKYGRENVCQIATFGRLSPKSVIRDVARVLDFEYARADVIAKLVPDAAEDLAETLKLEPELAALVKQDEAVAKIFAIGARLEGLVRNPGTHAAGVVISDRPITEYCPLFRSGEIVSTQYEKKAVEKIGLMKMDFLGLVTLTIIDMALKMIKKNRGIDLDINTIPLDKAEVFAMLGRGETLGVFQLESSGMQDLVKKLKPDCFEDIIALVALYRPGPLGTGMVDKYIDVKHGRATAEYFHPLLESILKPTYGLFLYQEQIIQTAHDIGGFTLSQADNFRKAMGKKQADIMARYAKDFVAGCVKNKVPAVIAEKVYDNIRHFAEYGFNKSHSAAYGLVAYQTAFLKVFHPLEFRAALLTSEMSNTDKMVTYMEEAEAAGHEVLPPDINRSDRRFVVEGDKIRFALEGIKRVGGKAVSAMLDARDNGGPFTSLHDFCERVDLGKVNKQVVEGLVKSGAMDAISGNRAQKLAVLENAMRHGHTVQTERATGQMGLFQTGTPDYDTFLPDVPPLDDAEVLRHEKEVLGFYMSRHPLARHRKLIEKFSTERIEDIRSRRTGKHVVIGGMVKDVKTIFTKTKNEKMAVVTFDGLDGSCRVIFFPKAYAKNAPHIKEDGIFFVEGKIDNARDENTILADRVIPLDEAAIEFVKFVRINLSTAGMDATLVTRAADLFRRFQGDKPVRYEIETHDNTVVHIECGRDYRVRPVAAFCDAADELFGKGHVSLEAHGP